MTHRRLALSLTVLGVLLLTGCDLATKELARQQLKGRPGVNLVSGVLRLTYVENRDTGFGLLRFIPESPRRSVIVGIDLLMVPLLLWFWLRRAGQDWKAQLGCMALLAGALGNLGDRLLRGYVVDFMHLRHWPVFNVADVLLVIGVGLITLSFWRRAPAAASPS